MTAWRSAIGRVQPSVAWLVPANALLFLTLSVTQRQFLTDVNLGAMATSFAVSVVIAMSQMVVIAAGGMNLSIGSIGSISGLAACFLMASGVAVVAAIAIGLVIGVAAGGLNGLLVDRFGLSPFIVTLATASVFSGITLGFTQSQPITGLPAEFRSMGQASYGGIPALLLLAATAAVLVALVFRYTGFGRRILAFGGNPSATALAGVRTSGLNVGVHALSGALAAWAGILLLARIGQGQPDIGGDWLLPSFAAPIIGGTLLAGGYLSVTGTALAAALLTQVSTAVVFLGIDPFWSQLMQGAIIVFAAVLDRVRPWTVRRPPRAGIRSEATA